MRVLALIADRQQGRALGERFYARFGDKLDMHVLPDAFSASEMLERFNPELFICAAQVGKMKGLDFHAFIRRDPKFKQAVFILLDSALKDKLTSALSAALHTYATPEEVLRTTFKLMVSSGKLRDTRHDSRLNTSLRAPQVSSARATGSFEVLTLFDLVTLARAEEELRYAPLATRLDERHLCLRRWTARSRPFGRYIGGGGFGRELSGRRKRA